MTEEHGSLDAGFGLVMTDDSGYKFQAIDIQILPNSLGTVEPTSKPPETSDPGSTGDSTTPDPSKPRGPVVVGDANLAAESAESL